MYFEPTHDGALDLTRACLIYGRNDNVVITENPVVSGRIMPGRVIDRTTAGALFAQRVTEKTKDNTESLVAWRFPRTFADHPSWNIWWSAPGVHGVFVAGKPVEAWFPGMIWCGHRTSAQLFLFAYDGASVPRPGDVAYKPRFGPEQQNHIHEDSALCIGSARTDDKSPLGWENAFFDSGFKTAGNLSPKPFEVAKRFKKIGTIASCIQRAVARSR